MMIFAKGTQVKYKDRTGFIEFICDQYVTICVETYDDKYRTVCMLVCLHEWKDIEIIGDYETDPK